MSTSPRKILVIDDDPGVQQVIAAVLERGGYAVTVSAFLATAVGDAITGGYDLITLDLNMPGIDGRNVAKLFHQRGVQTPIVIVSAFIDEKGTERLQASGVRHFVSKPFSSTKLLETVQAALEGA